MNETTATVLTPPGNSAVAVLAVRGPRAWPVIRGLFRTAVGKGLSEPPTAFVFGRIGDQLADEVIVSAVEPDTLEIHCHGGPRVVAWLLELLQTHGVAQHSATYGDRSPVAEARRLLPLARTARTAAILLDQIRGAYDRAIATIDAGGAGADIARATLRRNARVGRHLVEPWTVAIAGAPNAGKSSLLNALAGFARSIVSPVPGTTRDVVSVSVAFDGWPVDLVDTAGLRNSPDALESEGVSRARKAAESSDLVLWVVDAIGPRPGSASDVADFAGVEGSQVIVVFNKTDLATAPPGEFRGAVRVSAVTAAGLGDLVARIVAALVPEPPAPGDPVPFTPELCDRWSPP